MIEIRTEFIEKTFAQEITREIRALDAAGSFSPARIGRGESRMQKEDVRGDRIFWIEPDRSSPTQNRLWTLVEEFRLEMNRTHLLGLFEFEGHYAIYPPGSGYQRHLDVHRATDARVLSFVLYLNENWEKGDGGQLVLYNKDKPIEVLPESGKLVAFLSAEYEHEVLSTRKERLSFTGWFRRREIA